MIPPKKMARLSRALPFWLSLLLVPALLLAAAFGGWALLLPPLTSWGLFSIMDAVAGLETENADPETPIEDLSFYRVITLVWLPVQTLVLLMLLGTVPEAAHLAIWEKIAVFCGFGVASGTVGITYAHELMHQKNRIERWLADLLMASVLYSHFRSEHLLVHHRYVGTPRDPVTARYNEGFHRFYPRVLRECLQSAWAAETALLARRNLPAWHSTNPFWRYGLLQLGWILLAGYVGGWAGIGLFLVQAGVAIWQLELVNYVEHYGLTRKHLGEGRYEHVQPHHSWNASQKASNWLLINLQRHSDHHYKPDRRFPLLQTYDAAEAPQLPHGYPVMTALAMIPPLWRQVMNPLVRDWRQAHYPEIEDWGPYKRAELPLPR
ncbi:alkane 1-monooxygenase [Dinoroseobacter sp. S375]|uniref:alkane 1-monooxygenase n=1 Tax=Dinoroseobacter sp. S375 TaxID=3415136 RepID=UPI003C7E1EF0